MNMKEMTVGEEVEWRQVGDFLNGGRDRAGQEKRIKNYMYT